MANRRVSPPVESGPLPPFEGALTVLGLFDTMIDEPARFRTRSDWPLLWITAPEHGTDLLKPLTAHYASTTTTAWVNDAELTSATSANPTVTGGAGQSAMTDSGSVSEPRDPTGAVRLLCELATELRTGEPRIGNGTFRRFDFVHWLMHQRLPDDGRPARRHLALRHRRYLAGGSPTTSDPADALPKDPWWSLPLRLIIAVLVRVGYGLAVRWLPHYRWLRRQHYLNRPVAVTDVLDLAVRATASHPGPERQAALEKLLVHAFLTDLERRSPARWWPPVAKRRTRQPVLLFVDNVADTSAADRLLRLIAAVRNETGQPDPVVAVVCARTPGTTARRTASIGQHRDFRKRLRRSAKSRRAPGDSHGAETGDVVGSSGLPVAATTGTDALPPGVPEATIELDTSGPKQPLDTWRVRHRATDPADRSWQLRLLLPPAPPPGQHADQLAAEIDAHRPPRPSDLPTWAVATTTTVTLVVGAGALGLWWNGEVQGRCGVWFPAPDTRLERVESGHCIGVTDLTDHTFTPVDGANAEKEHADLVDAQDKIRQNNEDVLASGEPYVTVVYLGSIADRDAAGGTVAAPRTELQGLAIAQQERLTLDDQPLLRVLVANGGPAMKHAEAVAEKIDDVHRSTRDRSDDIDDQEGHAPLVGVVGLGQSVSELEDALAILERSGLPQIGSITSYDGLPDASTSYFQVGPNNHRQARVAAYFARREFPDARDLLVVESSARNDTYSKNLSRQVDKAFTAAYAEVDGFDVQQIRYRTDADSSGLSPEQLATEICAHQGLVFYAGRAQDLARIARAMEGCGIRPDRLPEIIAGDDVSRAVLEEELHDTGLELSYVPLATSTTNDRANCAEGDVPGWMQFYRLHSELFGGDCPDASDGRMLLTYDAVLVLMEATEMVLENSTDNADGVSGLTGLGVRYALDDIRGDQAIEGASGLIDYGPDEGNRVPVNKAVSVLRIAHDPESSQQPEPELVLRCGPLYPDDDTDPEDCPR